jgi:bacterioferritin
VTEQVHRGEVVRGRVEVPERVGQDGEEWVAPEPVQVRGESVYVQNAERLLLMRSGFLATIRPVQNVVQGWQGNRYWKGVVQCQFRQLSMTEMKHAEKIVERLRYLNGIPTTKPSPITVRKSLKESLELDVKAEEETIQLFKKIMEQAQQEDDVTTGLLFKQILADFV